MKSSDQEIEGSGIVAESWLHHFKKINTVNNSKLKLNNEYLNAMKLCKIPEGHPYHDCNITANEIRKARQKLQNNKASSMDSIPNEMLNMNNLLYCLD